MLYQRTIKPNTTVDLTDSILMEGWGEFDTTIIYVDEDPRFKILDSGRVEYIGKCDLQCCTINVNTGDPGPISKDAPQ